MCYRRCTASGRRCPDRRADGAGSSTQRAPISACKWLNKGFHVRQRTRNDSSAVLKGLWCYSQSRCHVSHLILYECCCGFVLPDVDVSCILNTGSGRRRGKRRCKASSSVATSFSYLLDLSGGFSCAQRRPLAALLYCTSVSICTVSRLSCNSAANKTNLFMEAVCVSSVLLMTTTCARLRCLSRFSSSDQLLRERSCASAVVLGTFWRSYQHVGTRAWREGGEPQLFTLFQHA